MMQTLLEFLERLEFVQESFGRMIVVASMRIIDADGRPERSDRRMVLRRGTLILTNFNIPYS